MGVKIRMPITIESFFFNDKGFDFKYLCFKSVFDFLEKGRDVSNFI